MGSAANPEEYLAGLRGWQGPVVRTLREAVLTAAALDERIKWGHLVYASADGPACLIRAEPTRVLFGFWRGRRLRDIEPRLRPGGKYEMATLELREGDAITPAIARALVKEAVALNAALGDPTDLSLAKGKTTRRGPAPGQ
jgi:hypothetical protein